MRSRRRRYIVEVQATAGPSGVAGLTVVAAVAGTAAPQLDAVPGRHPLKMWRTASLMLLSVL
ncbi:hypothetical protein [Micromonospora pallida]|uniref:hypothetical protein n=1 Tax=Micromonospora pallida TaxID=145854 RepID=UPI00114C96D6|nr:hypothetical protein [Micromonospora pallida]